MRVETAGGACGLLTAACVVACLLTLYPASHFYGNDGVLTTVISAVSCAVSGCVVFLLAGSLKRPVLQVFGALMGMGIRAIGAMLAALVLQFGLGFAPEMYLLWLGGFYLLGLAVETAVLLKLPTRNTSN